MNQKELVISLVEQPAEIPVNTGELPADIQTFTAEAQQILKELRENLKNAPENAKKLYEASISTCTKEYRRLAMKYHPDRNPEGPKDHYEKLFTSVSNSYGDLIKKGSQLLNGETIYDEGYFKEEMKNFKEELSVYLKICSINSLLSSIFEKKSAYQEKYSICKPSKEEADLGDFFQRFFKFYSEIDLVKESEESPKQKKQKLAKIKKRILSLDKTFEAFLNEMDKKFMERYELKYSKKYSRVFLCTAELPEKIEVDAFYLIEIKPSESKTVLNADGHTHTTYTTSSEIELFIPEIGSKNLKFNEISKINKIFPLDRDDYRRTQRPQKYPSFPTQNESPIEITDEALKKLLLGALGAVPVPLSPKLILMAIQENVSEFFQRISEIFAFLLEKASEFFRGSPNNSITSDQAANQREDVSITQIPISVDNSTTTKQQQESVSYVEVLKKESGETKELSNWELLKRGEFSSLRLF